MAWSLPQEAITSPPGEKTACLSLAATLTATWSMDETAQSLTHASEPTEMSRSFRGENCRWFTAACAFSTATSSTSLPSSKSQSLMLGFPSPPPEATYVPSLLTAMEKPPYRALESRRGCGLHEYRQVSDGSAQTLTVPSHDTVKRRSSHPAMLNTPSSWLSGSPRLHAAMS